MQREHHELFRSTRLLVNMLRVDKPTSNLPYPQDDVSQHLPRWREEPQFTPWPCLVAQDKGRFGQAPIPAPPRTCAGIPRPVAEMEATMIRPLAAALE